MASEPDATDPRLGDLSESQVLRAILARTEPADAAILGPGDDAAVIAAPSGSVVVTTDTLVEGPDFRRAWSSGYDLGWKSAAVNLADVAAMGARPTALFVALALPKDLRLSFIEQLAEGFRDACAALAPGCAVAGGDLTRADAIMVAVTALGDTGGRAPVTRSGARPGDIVALAGEMGLSARGLEILFERFSQEGVAQPIDQSVLRGEEVAAVRAQLRPEPPIGLGPVAAAAGATAMMDVSDGLALDARRLAAASGVTIDLERAALGEDPERSLAGGEDHALLATFASEILPPGFRRIGTVREMGEDPLVCDGATVAASGWDPYQD